MINLRQNIYKKIFFPFIICIIFVFGFLAGIAPAIWSRWYLTTPDSYTIVNYAQYILDNHRIVPHSVYQFIQIITAGVSFATGLTATQSFIFLTALAVASLSVVTFFLGKTIFRSNFAGLFSGFLVIGLPFIGRAIVLTPQNIFGFLFLGVSVYIGVLFLKFRSIRWFIAFLFSLGMLLFAHPLSFGVFFVFLLLYLPIHFWRTFSWKYRLFAAFIFPFLLYFGLTLMSIVLLRSTDAIGFITRFLVEISTTGLSEPIILYQTYPTVFGPITVNIIIAAAFVFIVRYISNWYYKRVIIVLMIVPLVWANLYLLGVNFLSYRVILYLWLPASIMIAFFLLWHKSIFTKKMAIIVTILLVIIFANIGFNNIYKHYDDYGKNFVPTNDDLLALKWLQANKSSNLSIMSIERWPQIQNNVFGSLYPELGFFIVTDLTESLEPPKPPTVSATEPSSTKLLGKVILQLSVKDVRSSVEDFDNQTFERRKELFYGSKFPDSPEGRKALDKWGITHVYLFRNIQEYDAFRHSSQFVLQYSNDTVTIFERVKKDDPANNSGSLR